MISIKRERWVVILDDTKIFCGLARNYHFKEIDDIGNTPIKTYLSENKARAGFEASWYNAEKFIADGRVSFVKVNEIAEEVERMRLKIKYNDVPFVPSEDCSHWESCQEEAYNQGRQDAIEEFIKSIEEHQARNWIDNLEYGITFADLEEVAEQLKGERND